MMRSFAPLCLWLLFALLAGAAPSAAQDAPMFSAEVCAPVLEQLYVNATIACINKPANYWCNGGAPPVVEPSGPISSAMAPTGALVELGFVDALRTPRIAVETGSAGIMWLRHRAWTGLLIGDVSMRDISPPDFPPWQSFIMDTAAEAHTCAAAPRSGLVVQSAAGETARLVINGASLVINGTALVYTRPNETIFVGLGGLGAVLALGQEQSLWAGQQISVAGTPGNLTAPAAPPSFGIPFDPARVENLPTGLFDRPILLPQPGVVSTLGAVNLRTLPSTDGAVIVQVPAGEILSVLGASPDRAWLHVRRTSGESGWMFADLLGQNTGVLNISYQATPLPAQRYGDLGRRGRVIAPAGAALRAGPDPQFNAIASVPDGTPVTLLTRSPYSIWVKVDVNGVVGWLPLLNVETAAYYEALTVDRNAPPQPVPLTATPVPGSFGNAFPDPNRPGN